MADMELIRARQADPTLLPRAFAVAQALGDRIDDVAQRKLAARAKTATSKQAKVILLRQLADNVGKAAAGLVPCKRGCNHCCHMATMVSVEEAEMIARDTGARLSMPARFNQFGKAMRDQHNGTPCTFLTEQGCSIYAQRPFACRVHHTVDADNLLCEIVPGELIRAPSMNLNEYDEAFAAAFGGALAMRYADIREFFVPQVKQGTTGQGKAGRDAGEPRAGEGDGP